MIGKTVFFSVGEPSGDQHAARLIEQLLRIDPTIRPIGLGGESMRQAGCQIDVDLTRHAVVGLVEVLPKLREFFRIADRASAAFEAGHVDAVVLVDFPGFNWHIAKRARRQRIPVYYYCPPQLWAWGGWRIGKLQRNVDHVLSVLPIETEYFRRRGVPVTEVGHPFFDAVASTPLDATTLARATSHRDAGGSIVAVLPGSRDHEVRQNWPIMLAAIRRLAAKHAETRFWVAAHRDRQCVWCREQIGEADKDLNLDFFVGRTSEIIEGSDCAMMVSGSVSLELLARRKPAAVLYRVGRLLHAFGRGVLKIDSITLPNLLAPRKVFPEFVSSGKVGPAVDFLVESIDALLGDLYYRREIEAQLGELADRVARPGASRAAAEFLADRLDCRGPEIIGRAA